jgi:hypothetical protein
MSEKNYTLLTWAYNDSGVCIGDVELAKELFQLGIDPQPAKPRNQVCSIGWCEHEQKWYGWSHRARWGFGIGSGVKKGDIAYNPANLDDWIENKVAFEVDEYQTLIRTEIKPNQKVDLDDSGDRTVLTITTRYNNEVPIESRRNTINHDHFVVPETFGRGEWTAQTLEDAKQMAIDFADNTG